MSDEQNISAEGADPQSHHQDNQGENATEPSSTEIQGTEDIHVIVDTEGLTVPEQDLEEDQQNQNSDEQETRPSSDLPEIQQTHPESVESQLSEAANNIVTDGQETAEATSADAAETETKSDEDALSNEGDAPKDKQDQVEEAKVETVDVTEDNQDKQTDADKQPDDVVDSTKESTDTDSKVSAEPAASEPNPIVEADAAASNLEDPAKPKPESSASTGVEIPSTPTLSTSEIEVKNEPVDVGAIPTVDDATKTAGQVFGATTVTPKGIETATVTVAAETINEAKAQEAPLTTEIKAVGEATTNLAETKSEVTTAIATAAEKSSPAQGKAKALKTRSASATNGTLADGPKQNKGGPITSMRNFFGRIFASKPPANPPSQSGTTLDAATTAVSTATSAATSTVAQAELPKTDSIPTVETESVPFNNSDLVVPAVPAATTEVQL